ncbi:zinc ribbon domain-containing protein [Streptomyces sp. NPDC005791]|uniref:zinc ribbon domain-containing protein n=1 Tax=Streptomyces sp. NPDC005791 TaxID=3364732 RepID=UPI0036A9619C
MLPQALNFVRAGEAPARVGLRKGRRTSLHSWSFHQLGAFIEYKARRAGVPLVYVDPAYTSRQCSQCGYTDRRAKPCGQWGVSHASQPPHRRPGRRRQPSSQLGSTSKPGPSGPGQVD